jgi:hypothetical protein
MTDKELLGLKPGELVRHKLHGSALIVHHNNGMGGVIAVKVQHISNSQEWHRVNPDGSIKAEGDE